MPALTRRRDPEMHQECWHIYYDNIPVGTITERAGVPHDVDQWGWAVGFYPGLEPGQHSYGSSANFEEARAGFEADWQLLLPKIPKGAFDKFRADVALKQDIRAKRARGELLNSQIPSSIMNCVCGVRFDSHNPSYPHRVHIYAAQARKERV
jgi:hypothetical protein